MKYVYIAILFIMLPNLSNSQVYPTCEESIARPLCQLIDINGVPLTFGSVPAQPTSNLFCENVFAYENALWFSFVAEAEEVNLFFNIDLCEPGPTGVSGIRAGLWLGCPSKGGECLRSVDDCIDSGQLELSSALVPGELYSVVVDGCEGSICNFEIIGNMLSNQPYISPNTAELSLIGNESASCSLPNGFICEDGTLRISVTDKIIENIEGSWRWSIEGPDVDGIDWSTGDFTGDGGIVQVGDISQNMLAPSHIDVIFPTTGMFRVCLEDYRTFCGDGGDGPPACISIEVTNEKFEYQFRDTILCRNVIEETPFMPEGFDISGRVNWDAGPITYDEILEGNGKISRLQQDACGCDVNYIINIELIDFCCYESLDITGPLNFITNLNPGEIEIGDQFCVDFSVENFNFLVGFNLSLAFSPLEMEYISGVQQAGALIGPIGINQNGTDQGLITLLWRNFNAEGQTLQDSSQIFTLCFEAKQRITSCAGIRLNSGENVIPNTVFYQEEANVGCEDDRLLLDGGDEACIDIQCSDFFTVYANYICYDENNHLSAEFQICGFEPPYRVTIFNLVHEEQFEVETDGLFQVELDDVDPGTYEIVVLNDAGSIVGNLSLNIAAAIDADLTYLNPLCEGVEMGSLRVENIRGGAAPFTVVTSWGQHFLDVLEVTIPNIGTEVKTITIIDALGCSQVLEYVVDNTIEELQANITLQEPSCVGSTDGVLLIEVTGGTPTASGQYIINGFDVASLTSTSIFADFAFDETNSTYSISIQDSNGCSVDSLFQITTASDLVIGEPCNDNDPTTINDVVTELCLCEGTFIGIDADGDNVGEDTDCDDNNPEIGAPGSPCDDGNPTTENDTLDPNCECVGDCKEFSGPFVSCLVFPNSIEFTWNPNPFIVAYEVFVNGANQGTMVETKFTVSNLPPNATIVVEVIAIDFTGCKSNPTESICQTGAALDDDGDGFGNDVDCDDNDNTIGPIGGACDDMNPHTFNDLANDDCECQGDCQSFLAPEVQCNIISDNELIFFWPLDMLISSYEITVNGMSMGAIANTNLVLNNLTPGQNVVFELVAVDISGCMSATASIECSTTGFNDLDGDGFGQSTDCDDANPNINPDAIELCDGVDNNCDGVIDEGFPDLVEPDGFCADSGIDFVEVGWVVEVGVVGFNLTYSINGFTETTLALPVSTSSFLVADLNQADEVKVTLEALYPTPCMSTSTTICCEASISPDNDGDGYDQTEDCDDGDPNINPGAIDIICDGIDNDCDGLIDAGFVGGVPMIGCEIDQNSIFIDWTEVPFAESYNVFVNGFPLPNTTELSIEVDNLTQLIEAQIRIEVVFSNNCAGTAAESECIFLGFADLDGDGFTSDQDCDDNNPNINPGLPETPYNGIDDDCDETTVDDDLDGDGFLMADDCDDDNPNANPNGIEIPDNMIDEDCNGVDSMTVSIIDQNISKWQVYPNPARTFIRITDAENLTINLIDITGQRQLAEFENGIVRVEHLAAGVYVLLLKKEEELVGLRRFVKAN